MKPSKPPFHVVFSGGGTGGHLFPGLAVAAQLRAESPKMHITFAGSGREFERRHVAAHGYEYLALSCRPLPRGPWAVLPFLTENMSGYRQARRFLRDRHVAVVVGLGGFASVPMARAAASSGLPLVLLEQNAVAGRATRWLAASAASICLAFDAAGPQLHATGTLEVTGNPIRADLVEAERASLRVVTSEHFRTGADRKRESVPQTPLKTLRDKRLLILGGSQGAASLNASIPRALSRCVWRLKGWQIVHQSGEQDLARTRDVYRAAGIEAHVEPFFDDLPQLLRHAGLAVSRAGGTTLAELAAAAVPAILLPYPRAADDHQRKNAEVYAATDAARLIDERRCRGPLDHYLAPVLFELLGDPIQRAAMSAAMRRLARPDAARRVATIIRDAVRSSKHRVAA
ncbi:MAG: UDP-N-acetylglucosamine--N-acetylmuramyl-(pentapeptide) pyrophosphoryl-undecaprenol N-acetylglucosamine transferase [Pirellulales bacterium]